MQILSRNGIQVRTRLMTQQRAENFARCLNANPHFQHAAAQQSARAKSPTLRWFVVYEPTNAARTQAMLAGQQESREERALAEGGEYLWVADDTHRFFWCQSASGEVYEVTERSCTCPDHEFRCRHHGLSCKHRLALAAGAGWFFGMPAPFPAAA